MPLLPPVQCLENYSFKLFFSYLFLFLVASGESVNLVPVIPSWPETEASGSMNSVKCI